MRCRRAVFVFPGSTENKPPPKTLGARMTGRRLVADRLPGLPCLPLEIGRGARLAPEIAWNGRPTSCAVRGDSKIGLWLQNIELVASYGQVKSSLSIRPGPTLALHCGPSGQDQLTGLNTICRYIANLSVKRDDMLGSTNTSKAEVNISPRLPQSLCWQSAWLEFGPH